MQNQKSKKEIFDRILKKLENELAQRKLIKKESKKKLYYISAEFLMGRMFTDTLINLGMYDETERELNSIGTSLAELELAESEPSLGNGGLGRLAACFLDSMANLGLNAEGIGINYHMGLFRQVFRDNRQKEEPNPWICENPFIKKTSKVYPVEFGSFTLNTRMYTIDVAGRGESVNSLCLFDPDSTDEGCIREGIQFDKTDIPKCLTLFLYPDDSDENGRILRVYQEYFLSSCAAQKIVEEALKKGSTLYDLHEYAVVQINDTHPSMVIPELIRLLTEKGLSSDDAIRTVSKTVAYTNHTILAEALEKWPLAYIKKVAPKIVPIIEILDSKVRRKYDNPALHIIDNSDTVHMAHMDIHLGFSVNGVAKLHTEILKNSELNHFYNIYPHKFNNKTNGISFGRWLFKANPNLASFIEEIIGSKFKENHSELIRLKDYLDDDYVLDGISKIKYQNKIRLKNHLIKAQGISINENAVFDMQVKRLHEYKRQQLNALYLIAKYLDIKRGILPPKPICAIFGAKASPAYTIAKDIIHLILCLGTVISNDGDANKHIQVVMPENYNVSLAEVMIPACDISEQISLASKEASGTGNMKFMLNGAVTLGTEDGANVEIHSLVGDENIYIFGKSSDEVIEKYRSADYRSYDVYNSNPVLKEAVDFITSSPMTGVGNCECLERLKNELINKDWFMTFPDFDDYVKTRDRALSDYADTKNWAKKMLINTANAGYFSSDRTISDYNRDIWKI